jgi:hydroxyacylglutathione hydrolase
VYSSTFAGFCLSANYFGVKQTLFVFAILYFTALPRAYFPSAFSVLYKLYCSKSLGYHLRHALHARVPLPHSDFLAGVSSLPKGDRGLSVLQKLPSKGAVVIPVPILADNYAYLVLCCETKKAFAVDPADPGRVLQMLEYINTETSSFFVLTDVLCSHKHWDHAGGNRELVAFAANQRASASASVVSPKLKIYGSSIDRPDACTDFIQGGDQLTAAGNIHVRVLHSPGHTAGSVMFLTSAEDPSPEENTAPRTALFTGDCIFCGGCGAMFEVKSVQDVLQTYDLFFDDKVLKHSHFHRAPVLEEDVLVYVGHEYTERLFDELCAAASSIPAAEQQPYDQALLNKGREVKRLRSCRGASHPPQCTVPSTLYIERRTNPLLTLQRDVLASHHGDGLENLIYTSRQRTNIK